MLRRFHAAAAVTMVSTPSLMQELGRRGLSQSRHVDARRRHRICSGRTAPSTLDLPRPIFITVGRVAVEKNLEAFLSLDLPGTKVVDRRRPAGSASSKRRFPDAMFLGLLEDADLAAHLAAADVFVFPSLTDTFGVVQLEALACGVPVAAFPVTGPKDVIGDHPIGVLDEDLRGACLRRADDVARSLPRISR